ncbi:MAG: hypothetical protein Q8P41_23320 [Pseudomonadota bacterium]|nr:hypothetical protein [Pseudomonadota bacterium]
MSNVVHDGRVTPEREAEFQAFIEAHELTLYNAEDLRIALETQWKHLCWGRPEDAAFLLPSNAANEVTSLPEDARLFRLLNLSGVVPWFPDKEWDLGLRREGRPLTPREGLDAALGSSDTEWRDAVVVAMLGQLHTMNVAQVYHPLWCTPWDDLCRLIPSPAEVPVARLLGAVGVAGTAGTWWMGFNYRRPPRTRIFRPTLLDGPRYAWHFPTDPFVKPADSGRAMDLSGTAGGAPLREYVHAYVQHTFDDWRHGGFVLGQLAADVATGAIPDLRGAHARRLPELSSEGFSRWMSDPMGIL